MSKKKIAAICTLLTVFSCLCFAQKTQTSETELYRELSAAYQSKSYPSVITYAAQFESLYPQSLLLAQVLAYDGESLFRLGRLNDAETVLDRAITYSKDADKITLSSLYWKGRTLFEQSKFPSALSSFHEACVLYKDKKITDDKKSQWYNWQSILYAGQSFVELGAYDQSIPLLEAVISNGKQFRIEEYESALLSLFAAYSEVGSDVKLISVYQNVAKTGKSTLASVFDNLTIYAGDSYVKVGQYKNAYDCYSSVLSGGNSDLAAVALQKAYIVSSEHQRDVGQNPGVLLAQTNDTLSDYPELVSEFWTRLGIDAYNAGDFTKAASCFDNAESNATNTFAQLIGLYRADIALRSKNSGSYTNAATVLDAYAKKTTLSSKDAYYPVYVNTSVRYAALGQQWSEVQKNAPSALDATSDKQTKNETTYWYALASYKNGAYQRTIDLLATASSHNELSVKAHAYAKLQQYGMAEKIYKQLDEANILSVTDRLDYAKILLLEGYVNASYKQAVQVDSPEAWYVTALASFDRKDWLSAEQFFKKYNASSQKEYASYALFYCGYAQYRLGKTVESYATLTNFTSRYPSHELAWNSHMIASNVAIQNGKLNLAANEAEAAVKIAQEMQSSSTNDKLEQSIILCATIYADSGNYDKAILTLAPYSKQSSDFGVRARYQTAQIYAKQGKPDESDKLYGVIAEQFNSNALADDAAYRRGELYYSIADYNKAIARFDTYRVQFSKGSSLDASYFYEADCYAKLNQNDRAILLYITLVDSLPNSSYRYSAKKNLIQLYKDQSEYSEALAVAQSIMKEYESAAKKDKIDIQIDELTKLSSGEDEQIVKQRIAYENAGGLATYEGRVAGTKLVSLLWKTSASQKEALTLAQQLYSLQTAKQNEKKESLYAAQNAIVIAQSLRQADQNKDAAEKYLSAAQYARMNKNEELSARALYGAVESFDAAGMTADAKSTAQTMTELYPKNTFTTQAQAIVSEN